MIKKTFPVLILLLLLLSIFASQVEAYTVPVLTNNVATGVEETNFTMDGTLTSSGGLPTQFKF